MANENQQKLLLEAYNRGLLDESQAAAVEEAIQRGLLINENVSLNRNHEQVPPPITSTVFRDFEVFPERKPTPLQDKLAARQREVDRSFFDFVEGDIGLTETTVQTMGKGIGGPLIDIAADVAGSTIQGISVLVPDALEDPVIDTAKESFNWIANTDSGEFIGKVLDQGIDAWQGFKDKNEQTAKTIESVVDLAIVFAPAKVKRDAGPTPILKSAADKIDDIALKQATKKKRAFVERLVLPDESKKVKIEQALRTQQKGIFKKNVVQLSTRELEISDEVMKLGVGRGKSIQANLNIIQTANQKLANELDKLISINNTNIAPRSIFNSIDDAARQLITSNPVIVGNAATTTKRVADKAKEIVAKYNPTAHGLFKARKEFDTWVRAQKGQAIFDPATDSILSLSVRDVRNAMNSTLDSTLHNVGVHRKLKQQARLFDAIDNIAPKAANEAGTAIGRLWQNVGKALPIKSQVNRDLAILLGMSTFGAAATFAPWFAGTLVVGGGVVGATMGLRSPATKRGLAKLLALSDKAIKASRNRKMIRQLRLDRAYVVDLLKQANEPTGEGPLLENTNPIALPPSDPISSVPVPQGGVQPQQPQQQQETGRALFGPFDKVFGGQ